MKHRARPSTLALLAMAAALAPAISAQGSSEPPAAPPIGTVLEDQFGVQVDLGRALRSGPAVIAVSHERDAADRLTEWSARLRTALPAGVAVLLVADLSAVPFFVPRSAIVKQLREDYPGMPILLDWKGILSKTVPPGKAKNAAEAWVGGRRAARVEGAADEGKARSLAAALR